MKKLISILITVILLIQLAPTVLAKSKGHWNEVKALAHSSVAMKTKTGETYYGRIQSADDSGIIIQLADDDDFTPQEINFQRSEVASVWRAKLRFGQNNMGKGALLGAGAGVGVAFIAAAIVAGRDSSDPPAGAGLFPIYGAIGGAVLGAFWKKGHKKQELVYSI
jgi:hypothetical protein